MDAILILLVLEKQGFLFGFLPKTSSISVITMITARVALCLFDLSGVPGFGGGWWGGKEKQLALFLAAATTLP